MLPEWALPASERGKKGNNGGPREGGSTSSSPQGGGSSIRKGPLDAKLTEEIAGYRRDLGATLFANILARVAGVQNPRDIPNLNLQQVVDTSMKTCLRGMQSIRKIASRASGNGVLHDSRRTRNPVTRSYSELRGFPETGQGDEGSLRKDGGLIQVANRQASEGDANCVPVTY